ncbi:MAG: VPS10 domain-containing protein, partial [Anaerolineae bacterium]
NNGNYLYVYEPETFERILTDTERSVAYVDVDPNSGRAYVGRLYMTLRSTSLLVDGQEFAARLDSLSGPLRVDPNLGHLYVSVEGSTGGYLLVLDASTLDVLGAVPTPAGLSLQALDPNRQLLYLAAGEGRLQVWSATGGELPGPVEPAAAELPVERVQHFSVGPEGKTILADSLYRSDDSGESWLQVGAGLPDLGVSQAVISPDFARDQTLFAVTTATDMGLGIWKSVDGGRSWRMANTGLSDMAVVDLALSPTFGQDQTLFATTRRQGLFRSTDGGRSWQSLTRRYYEPQGFIEPPGDVVLSPTYAQDQTLFVAHDGLHRSVDGGQSWDQVFAENPASLALSADLASDGVVYGWFSSSGLLRSEDWGDTWQPASDDLPLQGYGSGRVFVPAAGGDTVYFVWMPSAPDTPAQYFRSQDSGVSWQRLETDLGPIITAVQLDLQGSAFLALDEKGRLARWSIRDLDWQPVSLPPVSQIECYKLVPSLAYQQDQVLYAVTEGAGILRSQDAGLTWQSTGFPLRVILGGPLEPVLRPPDTLLVGTELGLYRWQGSGPWRLSDGLPAGVAVAGPVLGADGALIVLVDAGGAEPQLYLSTDDGVSWTQPVPALPYPAILEDLVVSPAFASDRSAFLVGSREPLRSVHGGPWQTFGPPGEWNLSALDLSPAFGQDGLLFMRLYDNSLWRSIDGGNSWTEVTGEWTQAPMGIARGSGYRLPAVTFSPDYGHDGVLLTRAGEVVYRSTDGGATWAPVLDIGPLFAQAVFSPSYGRDGTIYLRQGQSLYHSTDRGATWQSLPTAPWAESDEIQLQLSPTFAEDATAVAWSMSGQLYRSTDGGRTWSDISAGLAELRIRQIHFAPGYAQSRLLFVVPFGGGLLKQTGQGPVVPITERVATPPPTLTPTVPPPAITPPPSPTPAPPVCAGDLGPFGTVLEQADSRLGCPQGPATQVPMAAQPFERGSMIWDSSTQRIYVLYDSGHWESYADTFVEGVDPAYDPNLPPPPRQPQRGFGKVWREQLGGPDATIGWALENERAVAGWRQPFENGLLLWVDAPADVATPGFANLLHDDGTWKAIPAAAPQ